MDSCATASCQWFSSTKFEVFHLNINLTTPMQTPKKSFRTPTKIPDPGPRCRCERNRTKQTGRSLHYFHHPLSWRGRHFGQSKGSFGTWSCTSGWDLQGSETEAVFSRTGGNPGGFVVPFFGSTFKGICRWWHFNVVKHALIFWYTIVLLFFSPNRFTCGVRKKRDWTCCWAPWAGLGVDLVYLHVYLRNMDWASQKEPKSKVVVSVIDLVDLLALFGVYAGIIQMFYKNKWYKDFFKLVGDGCEFPHLQTLRGLVSAIALRCRFKHLRTDSAWNPLPRTKKTPFFQLFESPESLKLTTKHLKID